MCFTWLVFNGWRFLHRSEGDVLVQGCTEEGQVPRSTIILLVQNEWMTCPPVPSPSFIIIKPTQHLLSYEWSAWGASYPCYLPHDRTALLSSRHCCHSNECAHVLTITFSFISTRTDTQIPSPIYCTTFCPLYYVKEFLSCDTRLLSYVRTDRHSSVTVEVHMPGEIFYS